MKTILTWDNIFRGVVICLLLTLLGAAAVYLARDTRTDGGEIILQSTPVPAEAVIYVTGAVWREGVYTLHKGERVNEAIAAAGGLTVDADTSVMNLAARISDEQHIHVPSTKDGVAQSPGGASATLVRVNYATKSELETLPGIGPALAQGIIDYRQDHGPFLAVEDLLKVPRIGETLLAKLRPLIAV